MAGLPHASAEARSPEIAFTFDDPTTDGGGNLTWQDVNERMLSALADNQSQGDPVCGWQARE